jgi:hypothetical protein
MDIIELLSKSNRKGTVIMRSGATYLGAVLPHPNGEKTANAILRFVPLAYMEAYHVASKTGDVKVMDEHSRDIDFTEIADFIY